jgi:hypothetical protein
MGLENFDAVAISARQHPVIIPSEVWPTSA